MLRDFEAAAASMLLFLKNVEEIEIYIRPRAGADGSHAEGSAAAGAAAAGAGGAVAAGAAAVAVAGGGGGGNDLVRVGRTRVAAAAAGGASGAELAALREMRSSRHAAAAVADGGATVGGMGAACTYELQLLHEAGDDCAAGVVEGLAAVEDAGEQREDWLLHWGGPAAPASAVGGGGSAIARGLGLSEWVAVAVPLTGIPERGRAAEEYASNPTGAIFHVFVRVACVSSRFPADFRSRSGGYRPRVLLPAAADHDRSTRKYTKPMAAQQKQGTA